MDRFKRDADDALSTLRYTHLKTLVHLIKRRNMLKSQDKATRQRRDAWFPQTLQQYRGITERDVQLRVARFLTSTSTEQERMMDEFGWAHRAVQPLQLVYKSNVRRAAISDEVGVDCPFHASRRSKAKSIVRSASCLCQTHGGGGQTCLGRVPCSREPCRI